MRPPSRASGASAAHAQSDPGLRFCVLLCSIFDESGERDYGPGRWKATAEAIAAKDCRLQDLTDALVSAITHKTRAEVVQALIAGTLHPAITIDWNWTKA